MANILGTAETVSIVLAHERDLVRIIIITLKSHVELIH